MHTKSKKSQLLPTLYDPQMRPSHELRGAFDWFMGLLVVDVDPPIELLALFARYAGFILNAVYLDNVPEKNWPLLYFARFTSHSNQLALSLLKFSHFSCLYSAIPCALTELIKP